MWKFSSQSGPPPEVVLFDRLVQSNQNLPFHFQKSLFPVLHVLCYTVIKISVETQIDHFDSIWKLCFNPTVHSIFPLIIPLVADCLVWQSEKGPQINTLVQQKPLLFNLEPALGKG